MGKTHDVPRRAKPRGSKSQKSDHKLNAKRLTPEEAARLAAFDAVVKMRDAQWAAMTPHEQTEELEAWEKVKKSVNENRAGYRQVFANE